MAPNIFFCLLCPNTAVCSNTMNSNWYISCDLRNNFQHWYLIYWVANAPWISIFRDENEEWHFLPLTRGHTLERCFSCAQIYKDWTKLSVYSSLGTIKTQHIMMMMNSFFLIHRWNLLLSKLKFLFQKLYWNETCYSLVFNKFNSSSINKKKQFSFKSLPKPI